MPEYRVTIVVEGQDKASGPLGGVQKALGGIGTVAGGILAANVLTGIATGVVNIGKAALSSYASYEQLGMSMQSLVARELVNASAVDKSTTSTRAATQAEQDRATWLQKQIATMDTSMSKMEAGSNAYLSAKNKANTFRMELQALGIDENGMVTNTQKSTATTLTMGDALIQASGKAKELQAWITKLAIKSPFTSEGVANALRTAMAYGFTVDQSQRLSKAMIDYASASGQGEASMDRIARALGQIKARGKLAAGEMMQLTEVGVPVLQILAKAFGKTTQEIVAMQEKGLIPADAAIEAITKSMETDFGGAAERMSGTFSGLLSSLQDIKDVGLRALFGGVFAKAQPALQKFVDTLSSEKFMASLTKIGEGLGNMIIPLMDALPSVIEFVAKVMEIPTVFENAGGGLTGLLTVITSLFGPEATIAVGTFLAALQNFATQVVVFFQPVIDAWNQIVANVTMAGPMVQGVWQQMLGTAQTVFGGIWEKVQGAMTAVQNVIGGVLVTISQLWVLYGAQIMSVVKFIWDLIVTIISTAINLISGVVTAVMQLIQGNWQGAWETIKSTFTDIWARIVTVFGERWGELVKGLEAGWTALSAWFSGVVKSVGDFFTKTDWGAVGMSIINGIGEGIKNGWNWLLDQVGQLAGALFDAAKKALGIASPSKMFAKVGDSMMLGMAMGINRSAMYPQLATTTAAVGAYRAVPQSVEYTYSNSFEVNGWQGDASSLAREVARQQQLERLME